MRRLPLLQQKGRIKSNAGQGRCFGIDRGKETVKKDEGNRNIIGQYL